MVSPFVLSDAFSPTLAIWLRAADLIVNCVSVFRVYSADVLKATPEPSAAQVQARGVEFPSFSSLYATGLLCSSVRWLLVVQIQKSFEVIL